jgi:hypothetical protein
VYVFACRPLIYSYGRLFYGPLWLSRYEQFSIVSSWNTVSFMRDKNRRFPLIFITLSLQNCLLILVLHFLFLNNGSNSELTCETNSEMAYETTNNFGGIISDCMKEEPATCRLLPTQYNNAKKDADKCHT